MIEILVVEDERPISNLIKINLTKSGYACTCVYDGLAAVDALDKKPYDLVLLDIMLPGADGYEVMEYLAPLEVPVIFLTAKATVSDRVRGLRMGADDYLTKPFGVMELISRVKALLRRSGEGNRDKCLTIGKIFLDSERHAVYVDNKPCELTYKEYELLKMLMLHAGIVTNRDDILNHVWGTDFQGESRTLDMHIKTLRQKLGEAGSMIKTVRNVGYILDSVIE